MPDNPQDYGQSSHYLGEKGEQYFSHQRKTSFVGGEINARTFQPDIHPGDCVLDFGCGGGYILKALHCARKIGVELNPAARAVAQENGIECFAETSSLPDGIADVVISNHALEHVPYPMLALKELKRILKPGGLLLLKLPIDDWRMHRKIKIDEFNNHLHTWTPQLLFNTLVESGFDKHSIQVKVETHAWFPGAMKAFGILPAFIFDFGCHLFSRLRRRRQLVCVARNFA